MMTEQELRMATIGFRTGYQDATVGGHFGLYMMHMAPMTDAELSDYWFGWHRAHRDEGRVEGQAKRRRK